MKRASKLSTVIPVISSIRRIGMKSQLPKRSRYWLMAKIFYQVVRKQNLKTLRLFLYNLFHIPILISVVWTSRRLLAEEPLKTTAFLWMNSYTVIDPFYILPILTVGLYYYNLQRFITKENKHTLISKARNFGQILLILWLPFLCNWPSVTSPIYPLLTFTCISFLHGHHVCS